MMTDDTTATPAQASIHRWVDEPVPALSNLTPRQARDHPTDRRARAV